MQDIWKLVEDTDTHNYFILEKDGDYEYCVTYMNMGCNNRGLSHGGTFLGEVKHVKFLTRRYRGREYPGYVFLKIKSVGQGSWDMTANLVLAPEVAKANSSAQLRAMLEMNLGNPAFYGRELHFGKKFEFNSCVK